MADEKGLSRRAFLLGGAAVALASCGETNAARTPVRTFEFESRAMQRTIHYAMSAPDNARGLIVCLHAHSADHRMAFDTVRVHDAVAASGVKLAVVGVDGGGATYWHKRASGVDPQVLIRGELLPRVDAELGRTLPRALLGWSMGGYGALLAAEQHPEEYRAVVAVSPALWLEPGQAAPNAFDDDEDYRRNDVFAGIGALAPLAVRVDCGNGDPFISTARAFASRLPRPNLGGFTAGGHDARYWRSVAPAQVATIASAFA